MESCVLCHKGVRVPGHELCQTCLNEEEYTYCPICGSQIRQEKIFECPNHGLKDIPVLKQVEVV